MIATFDQIAPEAQIEAWLEAERRHKADIFARMPKVLQTPKTRAAHARLSEKQLATARNVLHVPPVKRLLEEIEYWIPEMQKTIIKDAAEAEEYPLYTEELVKDLKKILTYLVQGHFSAAFKLLKELEAYESKGVCALPETLDFTSIYWVDVRENIVPLE